MTSSTLPQSKSLPAFVPFKRRGIGRTETSLVAPGHWFDWSEMVGRTLIVCGTLVTVIGVALMRSDLSRDEKQAIAGRWGDPAQFNQFTRVTVRRGAQKTMFE